MSSNEDALNIQRTLVAGERAKEIVRQQKLAKDIRGNIARNGYYQPENDPIYEFQPYPKWVDVPNGKSVIVQNKQEEDAVMGRPSEPARIVTVDTNALEGIAQVAPAKRGRPPKAKAAPLPPDLD